VDPVGSYCTDISQCTVNKTVNLNISLRRRTAKSQNYLDWLWGPPSLVFSFYQGSFSEVKWPEHLHLVLRSPMRAAIPPLPLYAFMTWRGAIMALQSNV